MSEFKIGDSVRFINTDYKRTEGLSVGDTGTISNEMSSGCFGIVPDSRDAYVKMPYEGWCFYNYELKLVEDKPVTTPEYSCIRVVPPSKPKRKILCGEVELPDYAVLKITNVSCEPGKEGAVQINADGYWLTAKALREAAALFTTLAEVLEENSNA